MPLPTVLQPFQQYGHLVAMAEGMVSKRYTKGQYANDNDARKGVVVVNLDESRAPGVVSNRPSDASG